VTGPEHYRHAENWIRTAQAAQRGPARDEALALAQYHATMAAASASALGAIGDRLHTDLELHEAWATLLVES
jgi:hypothetical protein